MVSLEIIIHKIRNQIQLKKINFYSIGFYLLIIYGILINIFNAIIPPNFIHPDEVYQTVEIAHSFVYGYGIVSWEWIPKNNGPIRSLITPLLFSIVFIIGEGLSLNYWTETLPLLRILLLINFLIGLYIASLVLKELDKSKNNYADKIFLILALFYHDFILYGSKTVTNTIVVPMVFFALLAWLKTTNVDNKNKWAYGIIGGLCVGTSIWLRPDSGIILAFFVILYFDHFRIQKLPTFGFGFMISFLINGLLDLLYFGQFFITFPKFLEFNSANSSFFGTAPFGWYFARFFGTRATLFYLFILVLVVLFYITFNLVYLNLKGKENLIKKFNTQMNLNIKYRNLTRLMLWSMLILFWWENQAHKEERFMISWEITLFLTAAYSIAIIIEYGYPYLLNNHFNNYLSFLKFSRYKSDTIIKIKKNITVFVLIIILFYPFFSFNLDESHERPWNNFNDLLESFSWIGQKNTTVGIGVVMGSWYTGGYSFLHQDVPIYHFLDGYDNDSTRWHESMGENATFRGTQLLKLGLIDHLVIPKYQYWRYMFLYNNTRDSGFSIIHTIKGIDIWGLEN